MVRRATLPEEPAAGDGGLYFHNTPRGVFFRSGCTLVDLLLGGGWAEDRCINIVGDKSTGKTLQVIEAGANYRRKYPDATIYYVEVEKAFDVEYARSIGLPRDNVVFPNGKELRISTIEGLERHLNKVLEKGKRCLYIVDSLDALSDEAEVSRDPGEGSYGAAKAKKLSEMFRKLNAKLSDAHVTLIIVSQVRDAIGVTFGKKQKRSGGKALDFYASQILWLTHIARLSRTYKGVKRPYGVLIKAQAEKSKVGLPFREAEYPIYFTYGVEDVVACSDWLKDVKQAKRVGGEKRLDKMTGRLDRLTPDEYKAFHKELRVAVKAAWADIEKGFVVTRRKYD